MRKRKLRKRKQSLRPKGRKQRPRMESSRKPRLVVIKCLRRLSMWKSRGLEKIGATLSCSERDSSNCFEGN